MRVRQGVAGVLLVLTAGCGHEDAGAADPGPTPVDEMSKHDGEVCPAVLPQASRESRGFGTDDPAPRAPELGEPQQAWICRYDVRELEPSDGDGAWYEWVRRGDPRELDAAQLASFASDLETLEPAPTDRACTADLGPRYLVSYVHERDLTGVVVDAFGCGDIRLTDDPHVTVPGEASQPGVVPGVLEADDLLGDLGIRR